MRSTICKPANVRHKRGLHYTRAIDLFPNEYTSLLYRGLCNVTRWHIFTQSSTTSSVRIGCTRRVGKYIVTKCVHTLTIHSHIFIFRIPTPFGNQYLAAGITPQIFWFYSYIYRITPPYKRAVHDLRSTFTYSLLRARSHLRQCVLNYTQKRNYRQG